MFRSLQLPPGSICVLLFVISWRYRLTASARMVAELSQLPARRRGTHCQHTFIVWRTASLHLDDYLRLICFLSTRIYSALGVSAIMRYINRRFTYLLTYLLANCTIKYNYFFNLAVHLIHCARRLSVERYSYSDVAGWVAGWVAGCPSHSGTVSTRLNLSENFFDHLKAPSF